MINLQLMNKAVFDVELTDKEFRALYLITNYAALNNTNTVQIHNGWLMDKLNLCERQVRNITNGLDAKGYIKKEVTGTKKNKNANTYTIIDEINDEIIDEIKLEKNCPLKNNIKEIKKEYKNNININTIAIEKVTTGNTDDVVCNEIANSTSNEVEPNKEDLTANGADSFNGSENNDYNNKIEVRTMSDNGPKDNGNNVVIPSCDGNKQSSFDNEDKISTSTLSAMGITPSFRDDDLDILFPEDGQKKTETDEWLNSINDNGIINDSIISDNCSNVLTPPQSCAAPPLKNEIEATGSDETDAVEQQPTDTIISEQDATGVANKAWDYKDWCDRMNKLQFISGFEDNIEEFKKQLQEMDELMQQLKQHGTPEQFKRACKNIHCWYGGNNWNMNLDFIEAAINLKNKYRYTQSTCR